MSGATDYKQMITQAANAQGMPPALLYGLLYHESGLNANAVNVDSGGSVDRGIAQINSAAHPNITAAQAYTPSYAIPFAANYLSSLKQQYGTWNRALQAYNSGSPTGAPQYAQAVFNASKLYNGSGVTNDATGGTQSAATGATTSISNKTMLTAGVAIFAGALLLVAFNKM